MLMCHGRPQQGAVEMPEKRDPQGHVPVGYEETQMNVKTPKAV